MPEDQDDHFQNGNGDEAVERRPYNAPVKRRTARSTPTTTEWNTFMQWIRGTMEYPDGGGFAGDVGRRLTSLEERSTELADAVMAMPKIVAEQTAKSISEAFIQNAGTVAAAKQAEDTKTESARKLLASTRLSVTTKTIITAVVSIFVIVVAAIIVNLFTHTSPVSIPPVTTATATR